MQVIKTNIRDCCIDETSLDKLLSSASISLGNARLLSDDDTIDNDGASVSTVDRSIATNGKESRQSIDIEANTEIIEELKQQLALKKRLVNKDRIELEGLMGKLNRKKKIKRLLETISRLTKSRKINFDSIRNETIILLKVIDTLKDDKIDYHINRIHNRLK